jgi:hypothetical protein
VEETEGTGENHWQNLSHNVVHLALSGIRAHTFIVVICTNCICSCKYNYHTTTMVLLFNVHCTWFKSLSKLWNDAFSCICSSIIRCYLITSSYSPEVRPTCLKSSFTCTRSQSSMSKPKCDKLSYTKKVIIHFKLFSNWSEQSVHCICTFKRIE